jgi:hypothetical protein
MYVIILSILCQTLCRPTGGLSLLYPRLFLPPFLTQKAVNRTHPMIARFSVPLTPIYRSGNILKSRSVFRGRTVVHSNKLILIWRWLEEAALLARLFWSVRFCDLGVK